MLIKTAEAKPVSAVDGNVFQFSRIPQDLFVVLEFLFLEDYKTHSVCQFSSGQLTEQVVSAEMVSYAKLQIDSFQTLTLCFSVF